MKKSKGLEEGQVIDPETRFSIHNFLANFPTYKPKHELVLAAVLHQGEQQKLQNVVFWQNFLESYNTVGEL